MRKRTSKCILCVNAENCVQNTSVSRLLTSIVIGGKFSAFVSCKISFLASVSFKLTMCSEVGLLAICTAVLLPVSWKAMLCQFSFEFHKVLFVTWDFPFRYQVWFNDINAMYSCWVHHFTSVHPDGHFSIRLDIESAHRIQLQRSTTPYGVFGYSDLLTLNYLIIDSQHNAKIKGWGTQTVACTV